MSYTAFASVYDELTKNVDYDRRAEYICELLGKYNIKDGLLLDLACGTGSLSVRFAKKGFEVIASDASEDMLFVAREKACQAGESIMFLCQRMEETDLYGTVGAVVCSLDSINHLPSVEALNDTFKRLSNFVDDGGVMIFDVNSEYKHREVLANNTFIYDEKNVFCAWQNSLGADGKTVAVNLDFFVENGSSYSRFSESFKETAFSHDELSAAARNGDFEIVGRFSEFTENSPTETDERIFYVLRRNKR